MNPKVSVIVPVYNVEKYLEKCLICLVRQSLEEIEICAVNDGSPDGSARILDRFAKEYPEKVRVFEKENGGLSDARNFGMDQAKGEYIAFLDGDDYVDLDLYARLYEKAEETGADAVACEIRYVWEDGRQKVVAAGIPALCEGQELKKVFTRFYPAVWNKLYRRTVLEKSGVRFKKGAYFEDVEFSHRLFPYFQKIAAVPLACVSYRQREGSITAKAGEKLFDYLTNWESIVAFFEEQDLMASWRFELEYAASRYLLATFCTRAALLEEKDFQRAVTGSLAFLEKNFPRWKKNPYLKKSGLRGLYLRCFTPALCRAVAKRRKG